MAGSPRSGCSWRIGSTAAAISYPDNIGTLKHLRFYNRLLPNSEIIANAGNNCFLPRNFNGLAGWYRFNVPSAGAPTTISANSTNETRLTSIYPDHTLATSYAYNSTNQVIKQHSPDGGTNLFWYDYLSRLTVSQNDKQGQYDSQGRNNYSYTAYDPLGRITEVGQKHTANTLPYSPADATVPDYADSATLKTFMASGSHSQITNTYYDAPAPVTMGNGLASLPEQTNLRKRVSASTYTETQGGPAQSATYYNYDLDGNVKTLWQQIGGLWKAADTASLKRVDYEYDLVSGKVNFVRYQQNQPDQFYYQYQYDAENRLTHAWSGTRAMLNADAGSQLLIDNKKLDAYYQYYLHGPLARLELGDEHGKVQGIDYAYTLQGWLKGVNGQQLNPATDIGKDGLTLKGDTSTIPRDAYAYSLGYYNGDYKPIGQTNATAFGKTYQTGVADVTGQSLYNGNISNSTVAISNISSGNPVGYTYHYDQLNRLKKMRQHSITSTAWNASTILADYSEDYTYDANGNILTALRNGNSTTGLAMDKLSYAYNRDANGNITNNRLRHVTDAVPDANSYTADLKTQPTDNYQYDALGNLIKDTQAGIDTINWTVYGKIKSIVKGNAANNIAYIYDAAGHRISKTANGLTTYYVRDAQGNTLALYDNANKAVNWREQHLYGSSRLGIWTPDVNLANNNALAVWDTAGRKFFELTNHLGNVIETITDRRLQVAKDTSIAYYTADVATAQDYYPFGMLMPGRQYTVSGNNYRYGFNGKENDNEVKQDANGNNIIGSQQDYGMRIYDPRLAKFLSVDPLAESYPYYSPYLVSGNNPIKFVDLNGLEEHNPVPEAYINPKLMIDMTKAPGSNTNSAGFVRNNQWFWRQMLQKNPEMFSEDNKHLINDLRRSPIVDEQWVKYNPSQGAFINETLVHHHFEQGNYATPLPEAVHKSWFKALHEVNPGGRARVLSNSLKNLHEGLGYLMFFYDLLSDDPHALNQQLRAGEKLNKLYYDMETNTYFSLNSRTINKDKKGNVVSTTVTYDQYSDYDYDKKSGENVGVGKINTYKATQNEKTGQVIQNVVTVE